MTSSNTPSKSTDSSDPWEELADLVGLEGGKEYVASTPPAGSIERPAAAAPVVHQPAETTPLERGPEPVSFGDRPSQASSAEDTFAPEPAAEVLFEDSEGDDAQPPETRELEPHDTEAGAAPLPEDPRVPAAPTA